MKVKDNWGLNLDGDNCHPWFTCLREAAVTDFICGVELEIESIKTWRPDVLSERRVTIEEDTSLRNYGREFILSPSSYEEACETFKLVHENIIKHSSYDHFSDRTSIHVHVNVRELELKQLRQLMLVYALFEPIFFDLVGKEREHNIYCVPLSYTYIPSSYSKSIVTLVETWHKYTAFNMAPAKEKGTVEFRHMYGTGDVHVFSDWLGRIKSLYDFVATNSQFDVLRFLESGGTPHELFQRVFQTPGDQGYVNSMCADSVLDVKLAAGGLK